MPETDKFLSLYRSLSDDRLRSLAKREYNDLVPEAQNALTIIIKERNLDREVEETTKVIQQPITENDINDLYNHRERIPCPHCGSKDGTFDVIPFYQFAYVYVYVIWKKRLLAGCKKCLLEELKELKRLYSFLSLLLPIQTIISLVYIRKIKKHIKNMESGNNPSRDLKNFIELNYANIRQIL